MRTILILFVVAWVMTLYGIWFGIEKYGFLFIIPSASVALIVVLFLEMWTYRYIKNNGRLHKGRES